MFSEKILNFRDGRENEKMKFPLSEEGKKMTNRLIKTLKRENILEEDFVGFDLRFNRTYDTEACMGVITFSIRNEIAREYDGGSIEVLDSLGNWEQYFKLFANFVGTPSDTIKS